MVKSGQTEFSVREIRAINVLLCVLRFYWPEEGAQALRRALPHIFETDPGGAGEDTVSASSLCQMLVRLGWQARSEEPSDTFVVARIEPAGEHGPSLVSWEGTLYRQLRTEYEGGEQSLPFWAWAVRRTHVTDDKKGVLLIADGKEGEKEARLVQGTDAL